MTLHDEVNETLTICALRFDGYKWAEQTFGANVNWPTLWSPMVERLEFSADANTNLAVFFALQRWLHKWGGEHLPETSPEHTAYRFLFLHLYRTEIPVEFRMLEFFEKWKMHQCRFAEEHAAVIRKVIGSTGS